MSELNYRVIIDGKEADKTELLKIELEESKIALDYFRRKLGFEGMYNLFREEFEESKEHFLKATAASRPGHYNIARTDVEVKGMTLQEYMKWYMDQNAAGGFDLLKAHPSHWGVQAQWVDGAAKQEAIEWTGGYHIPLRMSLGKVEDPAAYPFQPRYPIYNCGKVNSEDGQDLGIRALHQYEPTADGFILHGAICYPEGLEPEVVEAQKAHLAIEFSNWFKMGYEAICKAKENQ